jgi:hypothetical protein
MPDSPRRPVSVSPCLLFSRPEQWTIRTIHEEGADYA